MMGFAAGLAVLALAAPGHHHRHWVWGSDTCVVSEGVGSGSTAGAPTPLLGLRVVCRFVPGHWSR